jgi:hypothetical protein
MPTPHIDSLATIGAEMVVPLVYSPRNDRRPASGCNDGAA